MKKRIILLFVLLLALSAVYALPFTEDFTDNQMPPTGWTIEAGPGTLGTSESTHAGGIAPQGYINGWPQSIGTTRLISPIQDVSSYSTLELEFKHSVNSAAYGGFSLKIETTSDGGTTWNEVWSVTPTGYYAGVTETIEITNADIGSDNFQFCFSYEANAIQAIYHAYFDDFVLTGTDGPAEYTLPFTEDFTDGACPAADWTVTPEGATNWQLGTGTFAGGTAPEGYYYGWPQITGTTRMISPVINTADETALELAFAHKSQGASNADYSWKVETTSDGGTTWNEVFSVTPNGSWASPVEELIAIENGDVGSDNFQFCLSYVSTTTNGVYHYNFDEFSLTAAEATYAVTFTVEDGEGNPIEGADVVFDGTAAVTTDSLGQVVFEELEPGDYSYDVTATYFEAGSGTVTVVDADVAETVVLEAETTTYTLPFTEDFTDGACPAADWTVTPEGTTNWQLGTGTFAGGTAPEGYYYGWPQIAGTTRMISPVINTADETALELAFRHKIQGASNPDYSIKVETTSDGGTTWNEVFSVTPNGSWAAPVEELIAIENGDVGSENFQYCLSYVSTTTNGMYHYNFDEFSLTAAAPLVGAELPFTEDFTDNVFPPVDWSITPEGTTNWQLGTGSFAGGEAPEGYYYGWPQLAGTTRLITPEINTTGLTILQLDFKHKSQGASNADYSWKVETTSDGGTTWNEVFSVTPDGSWALPVEESIAIENDDVGSENFQFCLSYVSTTTNGVYHYNFDDFELKDPAAPTYAVTFTVEDAEGNPIEGADVAFDGASAVATDSLGLVVFEDIEPGDYNYDVTATDFVAESGTVTVVDADLAETVELDAIQYYTVTFNVSDGTDAIEGATVSINEEELTTDASGEATIELADGDYPYTVSIEDYSNVTDTVTVAGTDVAESVVLEAMQYNTVTFNVSDGSDPIEGAIVTINDSQETTDASGQAIITNAVSGDFDYNVFAAGYVVESGSGTIIDTDLIVDVVMGAATIYTLPYSEDFSADVMPPTDWWITSNGFDGWYTEDTNRAGGVAPEGYFTCYLEGIILGTTRLISPVFNTSTLDSLNLEFNHELDGRPNDNYSLKVETTSNGGATWNEVWSVTPGGDIAPEHLIFMIDNVDVGSETFQYCLTYVSTSNYGAMQWWFDDFELEEPTTVFYNVTFNIEDVDGIPIEGADVAFEGAATVATDSLGQVVFEDIEPGDYNYDVTATDFVAGSGSVTVVDADVAVDVVLETAPAFASPTNLFVDDTGYATWDAPGASRDLEGYNIYLDTVFVEYTTELFYEFTGLVSETDYLAEVTAVYDDPGESAPIEYTFTYIEFVPETLPFTEEFTGYHDRWTIIGGGDENWIEINNTYAGGISAPEADFTWNPYFIGTSYLTSPVIETAGLTALELEYKQYFWHYNGTGSSLGVATTSNGGVTWHVVDEVFPTADIGPETVNLSIANTDVGSSTFQLAFFFSGSTTQINAWFIDDVSITEGVATFNPATNLFVDDTGYATWDAPYESARNFNTNQIVDQRINASKNNNLNDNFTNNSNREFSGYNVYLDGDLVANTTDLSYQFTDLADANSYLASVTAVYDDPGESYAVEYQFVYNPGTINPPYNLFVDETGYASWEDLNNPEPNGIYSQLDNVSPEGGISAQVFVEMYTAYNSEGADEFVVPAGETWTINQVLILGSGPTHAMELANICFYEDDNGLPGDLLFDYPETAVAYSFDGDLNCIIPNTEFTEGTYWMGAQGFSYGDQWFWERQVAPTIGYEFCFRNPGDGFGSGHTNWVTASTHWPNNFDHNLSFGLYGAITDATGRVQIMAYDSNITKRSIETKSILDQDRKIAGTPLLSNKSSIRNSRNLLGYNIYLDGVNVAWTDGLYYQYSNLVHGTTYLAEVTALYDEGETVPTEYEFTYYEPSGLLPYTDDFSNGFDNWTIQGDGNWVVLANNYAGGDIPEAQFSWDPTYTGVSYLKSPIFDTSGYAVLNMEYKQYMWDYLGSGYSIGVATTSDGGVTWNIADEVFPTGDIGPDIFMINIATPDVGSDAFQFAFFFSGSTTQINHWFVDDVSVVGDPFSPPNNYTAEVQNFNDVLLTWDAPTGSAAPVNKVDKQISASSKDINLAKAHTDELRDLVCFTLYRDGIEIACLMSDTYEFLDTGLDAGDYEYTIIASYNDGDSYSVGPVAVTITLPAPTNLTATSEEADISLTWQAPTTSTRDISTYNLYRDSALIAEGITSLTYTDSALPNGTYVYEVAVVYDGDWEGDLSDSFEIVHDASGVEDVLPLVTKLSGNYPNPFNPTTNIRFALHQNSKVTIDVYNIKGEKVRTLLNGELEAGNHNIEWNGKDAQNKTVASGIFFYKMKAGEFSSIRKMILMK